MKKIDLKKKLKSLYQPSAKAVALVDVPTMNYLMIDGEGAPEKWKTVVRQPMTMEPGRAAWTR